MKKTVNEASSVIVLGRLASILSVFMYVSYIPQIIDNVSGNVGNPIQPFVTGVNCILWVAYSFFKSTRDWPILIANTPGIFLGFITGITAIIF